MRESKKKRTHPEQWGSIKGSLHKLTSGEAGITVPEQLVRILVIGLALAYSYILLN